MFNLILSFRRVKASFLLPFSPRGLCHECTLIPGAAVTLSRPAGSFIFYFFDTLKSAAARAHEHHARARPRGPLMPAGQGGRQGGGRGSGQGQPRGVSRERKLREQPCAAWCADTEGLRGHSGGPERHHVHYSVFCATAHAVAARATVGRERVYSTLRSLMRPRRSRPQRLGLC